MSKRIKRFSTGIPGLDELIEGGLPRGSSYHLKGSAHSGKTTLGMQMQYEAVKRGEACLFISYCEPWQNVIRAFNSFDWDIQRYLKKGNFKILDNASKINGLNTSLADVPRDIRHGICIIEQLDQNEYLNKQIEIIRAALENSKCAGLNVIDSSEFRERFLKSLNKGDTEIANYFQQFRTTLTSEFGIIGLHISTPIRKDSTLAHILDQIQEGTIELRLKEEGKELRRYLRIVGLPYTACDRAWHEFRITKKGIELLPE